MESVLTLCTQIAKIHVVVTAWCIALNVARSALAAIFYAKSPNIDIGNVIISLLLVKDHCESIMTKAIYKLLKTIRISYMLLKISNFYPLST